MKKLLLVIVVISVVFFAGCNKTENGSNNDTKEIFFDKVENESGNKVETFEKSGNKGTKKAVTKIPTGNWNTRFAYPIAVQAPVSSCDAKNMST